MVPYEQFARRVRRHRPSEVLAACGAVSAAIPLGESDDLGGPPAMPSFALAGIARAALLHGNEHRDKRVTLSDLRELVTMFVNVDDPFVKDGNLRSFLVRVGAEQFPYQALPFRDLARTRALFVDAAEATDQGVITQRMWSDLLGCTLDEFVGVAMLLYTSATKNCGRFDPRWLDQANFEPVFQILARDVIERVARESFLLSMERFREIAGAHQIEDPGLKRYSFNPLLVGPFVGIGENVPVAPVARAILFRATPGSLYYTAAARHGQAFTDALGPVFEAYVRRQLETCEPELLLHDLEYETGKRAVDFIVVLPCAVLLIEAKVTSLTQESRLGGKRFDGDYARAPGKGMAQIDNTARLIRERHPAFRDLPADRPCLGLVVTLEPYYGCTNQIVMPAQEGPVPKWLANIRELEQLVSLGGKRIDEALVDLAQDSLDAASVEPAIRSNGEKRNRILDEAWSLYPFRGA